MTDFSRFFQQKCLKEHFTKYIHLKKGAKLYMHNNKLTVFIFEMAPFREGSSQPNFIDKEVNNIKMFSLESWAMVNLKIRLRIHYIDSIQKGAIQIWNFENQSKNIWFLFYIKTSPNWCIYTNLKKNWSNRNRWKFRDIFTTCANLGWGSICIAKIMCMLDKISITGIY